MRETYEKIAEALDEMRPELISEGGDVKLAGFNGKTVYVRLDGPFTAQCLAKRMVLLNIQKVLRERFPWVERVSAVCPAQGFEARS